MKKCMRTALFLVLIAACLATTALAADSSVTYSGNSGSFIFAPGSSESPTDLFPDFRGVMPGDTLTEQIVVKNNANNKVDVKIYMRALGAVENEKFLKELTLTVKQGDKVLFDGTADETDGLTNWQPLGTFKSGSKTTLDVTLNVPIELNGEDFEGQTGKLQWEFRVEEYPIKEGPQTGDETPLALYGGLAALCAVGIVLLLVTKRKKRNEA